MYPAWFYLCVSGFLPLLSAPGPGSHTTAIARTMNGCSRWAAAGSAESSVPSKSSKRVAPEQRIAIHLLCFLTFVSFQLSTDRAGPRSVFCA
ncbi:MAG: hypothetical protein CMN77_11785 [Spirochaetaceae bacterium]|nr:hypothetical protein [Spirochaetaceae bacterium]